MLCTPKCNYLHWYECQYLLEHLWATWRSRAYSRHSYRPTDRVQWFWSVSSKLTAARSQMTPQLSRLVPMGGLGMKGSLQAGPGSIFTASARGARAQSWLLWGGSSCEVTISIASRCLQNYSCTSLKWNWGSRLVFFPPELCTKPGLECFTMDIVLRGE